MASTPSLSGSLAADIDKIHDSWSWFIVLGIALVALGAVCILGDINTTRQSVITLGWVLVFGAAVAFVQSFRTRDWSGFFLYFLTALVRGVLGYVLIRYPTTGEVSLTILLGSLFIVAGIFRAVGANALRFPSWGWTAFSGVVTVILGVMLIYQLPTASTWFIGLLIGVEFIIDGASLLALGVAVRQLHDGRDVSIV